MAKKPCFDLHTKCAFFQNVIILKRFVCFHWKGNLTSQYVLIDRRVEISIPTDVIQEGILTQSEII